MPVTGMMTKQKIGGRAKDASPVSADVCGPLGAGKESMEISNGISSIGMQVPTGDTIVVMADEIKHEFLSSSLGSAAGGGEDRRSSARCVIKKLPGYEFSRTVPSESKLSLASANRIQHTTSDTVHQHETLINVRHPPLHRCPHCKKAFMSRFGLVVHLDIHPKHTIRCRWCDMVFPSHRGLITHRRMRHPESFLDHHVAAASVSQLVPGLSADLREPVKSGFSDLTFADFSCRSFPVISRHWCEQRPRPTASSFHSFVCTICEAAFPIASALQLHASKAHEKKDGHVCSTCGREFSSPDSLQFHQLPASEDQSQFMQQLQLFPACIRSKDVCVDDTHLNTAYYSLLAKYKNGRDAASSAHSTAERDGAAADGAVSSSLALVTVGNNGEAEAKSNLLRRSRQS